MALLKDLVVTGDTRFTNNVYMSRTLNANGNIVIQGATTASNAYNSTNPKISFYNNDASQTAQLVFTDYDSVQAPASLTLVGGSGVEAVYFIAPNITATATLTGVSVKASQCVYANAGKSNTAGGLWLYDAPASTAVQGYGVLFRGTSNMGTHGSVTSDWATYLTMDGASTRGWVFRQTTTNVASISGVGNLSLNGNLSIGGSGTSRPAVMSYNSSIKAFEFTFG